MRIERGSPCSSPLRAASWLAPDIGSETLVFCIEIERRRDRTGVTAGSIRDGLRTEINGPGTGTLATFNIGVTNTRSFFRLQIVNETIFGRNGLKSPVL